LKREENLVKEFEKIKEPKRTFTFTRNIWFPKNWIIKKHENGEVSNIKTVIKKTQLTKQYTRPKDAVI
jgi:hypothetical protein